ncbi:thiamine biosynthesis protein ThiH [Paenibacillus sp. FSL R7-0273]|uniref:2-iminoacetate synthase ThiH n=1 Tax=Paenibacillus sp. FSL R7-0273 TaxID=1536772 RepID=UPI0004F8F8F3|nr:2-iminoacetate synthase ThiH [Paenibacillus sp. FSL R7-0273]AIQ46285.1 thiamine biosynthesis protein ThiH [Paenibacillus sp. FSL R7-0273]OMF89393.1 thiamine biosynthesis protein ThiH [Paenibacillus sp. FSL R7-0273]
MGFYETAHALGHQVNAGMWGQFNKEDVRRSLRKEQLDEHDLQVLLSPAAGDCLEEMARQARSLTRSHFGHVMQLFTPMYLADFCINHCTYCSFSSIYDFPRKKLSPEEVRREAEAIAATGIRHILILTGESRTESPVSYLKECVRILKEFFSSVSIEVNPLSEGEYKELKEAGVDGLTLYQEVYHEETYSKLHVKGPKKIYRNRLDAPERGCRAGFRVVNIGALLGMYDWRQEAFFTAMHARYLQDKYPECEIGLSAPRFRPFLGEYDSGHIVTDRALVQIILAYRLFLPRAGITLSTREPSALRDRLIHLGVTKMSAGVSTEVGGHTQQGGTPQFEISDGRSVHEISEMLKANSLQPVYKDWDMLDAGIY